MAAANREVICNVCKEFLSMSFTLRFRGVGVCLLTSPDQTQYLVEPKPGVQPCGDISVRGHGTTWRRLSSFDSPDALRDILTEIYRNASAATFIPRVIQELLGDGCRCRTDPGDLYAISMPDGVDYLVEASSSTGRPDTGQVSIREGCAWKAKWVFRGEGKLREILEHIRHPLVLPDFASLQL